MTELQERVLRCFKDQKRWWSATKLLDTFPAELSRSETLDVALSASAVGAALRALWQRGFLERAAPGSRRPTQYRRCKRRVAPKPRGPKLTDQQWLILVDLKKQPGWTWVAAGDVARRIGSRPGAVGATMRGMISRGLLEACWVVVPKSKTRQRRFKITEAGWQAISG